jgi:hypothetical protein
MATEDAYTCLLAQQSSGKIAASVPDDDLRFSADSEGWLSQANHLLHTGLTTNQYLEFDCATRKKAYTVRTALANNNETYVTIAKDMLPTKPGSQDVLNVCLTQASLEMQMKK